MIKGIHHVSLLVSSERTLEFYKLLGFQEDYRRERAKDCVALLNGYGVQLEVFIDNRHPSRATDISEPLGTRHFALKVDDIVLEKERLKDLFKKQLDYDPKFEEIRLDWTGERYVFFKDPDGNVVELHI